MNLNELTAAFGVELATLIHESYTRESRLWGDDEWADCENEWMDGLIEDGLIDDEQFEILLDCL